MNWHSLSIEETAKELGINIEMGLSDKEALKRLHQYGRNEIQTKKNKPLLLRFVEQMKDFMIITLLFAAAISFFVSLLKGELDFIDPIIILFIIILNALLGVIQEAKAEHSLEALKKIAAPTALVRRSSTLKTIDSCELVPGDIILLESGNYVPADARLVEAINLKVEESSLTGESHPVDKDATCILKHNLLPAERRNLVMATTMVTYGRGSAIVTKTGMNTEVGHIATLIMEDDSPTTPLQKKLASTSKSLGSIALLICFLIFITGIIKNRPIFDMFMTSVSLAVAAIPEGLPAIVTIMLSLGVQRMAKKNAVIRRLPAVETLGSATVICSDKTGTLTQNKMTVTKICSISGEESLSGDFAHTLFTYAALCNDASIRITKKSCSATGEPTENALLLAAYQIGINKLKLDLNYKRLYEIPFDSNRKQMTTLHKMGSTGYLTITKGAPEILLNQCSFYENKGKILPMNEKMRRSLSSQNQQMAKAALRVIAVSFKEHKHFETSKLESSQTFLGLIGMIDPPREEVKDAVMTCKKAGIKPIMITGDHISTACAIAYDLGILSSMDQAITGQELSTMSTSNLNQNIYRYSVFARVSPEHKVRIVKAFQENGEVVAMTGDGVNDAPALKAADIGCAMGIMGTDVAKNASDMILTDDNFATIVSAVKEGRGIYANIKKAIHFLLSSNIGEIITIFIAILIGLPSPLLAVQLLWVNLVTDSLPAIALGVEPPAKNIMKKKPVSPTKGMFADGLIFKITFEGIMIGFLALSAFLVGIQTYDKTLSSDVLNPITGRTMCFAVLSLSQLFHSFNMRSDESIFKLGFFSNPKLLLSFIICSFLQIAVISVEPLSVIFKVIPLNFEQWTIVLLLSFMPIVICELQKKSNRTSN